MQHPRRRLKDTSKNRQYQPRNRRRITGQLIYNSGSLTYEITEETSMDSVWKKLHYLLILSYKVIKPKEKTLHSKDVNIWLRNLNIIERNNNKIPRCPQSHGTLYARNNKSPKNYRKGNAKNPSITTVWYPRDEKRSRGRPVIRNSWDNLNSYSKQ